MLDYFDSVQSTIESNIIWNISFISEHETNYFVNELKNLL